MIPKQKEEIRMETIDYKFLGSVLEAHNCDGTRIISIMQKVQEQYRYLP